MCQFMRDFICLYWILEYSHVGYSTQVPHNPPPPPSPFWGMYSNKKFGKELEN